MIDKADVDPVKTMDEFLKPLKKWLTPHEYTRCVWLLDQREFGALHSYLARRHDVASRVSDRVRDEVAGKTLIGAFRHARRYHVAVNSYVHATKALIKFRRYVWGSFGLQVLLDAMGDWNYRDVS